MKDFMKIFVMGVATMALVMACEPGSGDSDADSAGTTGRGGTGTGTTTGATGSTSDFKAVEMEDDPNNSTLCDAPGGVQSPGADIDGGELSAGGSSIGFFAGCVLSSSPKGCANDNDRASDAEGAPVATGNEGDGGYVSLAGGYLRCTIQGGASIAAGQELSITEVGTRVENYRVRLCIGTGGNCGSDKYTAYGTGKQTFNTGTFF